MEGQEKMAKDLKSLHLREIITEDDTSGADELDKFSKLEMNQNQIKAAMKEQKAAMKEQKAAMEEQKAAVEKQKAAIEIQFRNNSKQLDLILHAVNEFSKFDLESQSNL